MHIKRIPTLRNKYAETIVHSFLSTCHALFSQYDIIQFHALGSSPLALLPRLAREKTVVSVCGLDGERAKWGKVAKRYLRACEWASVHCPSSTSVVSRQLAEYYAQKYRAQVTYIPNGITPVTSVPPNHIKAFGLGHRDYILYVGRLTPEKGCHDLLKAFKRLDTHYKLVFVGDSTYSEDYVERLKQDESDRIQFLGFQTGETLRELFSNAFVYVLPSAIEGLSIALLEAMGYGNCVLTSDIPENVELVKEHGFTFQTGNIDHLRESMDYLIQHPEVVEESGKAAKVYVEMHYNWDMIAHSTEWFFKSQLQDNSQTRE